ncbi:MAG: ATP-dependent Lon protease, partial [Bacillota bacterium]|nr:ATP-dependent Lon protease [Bacillota bacterium]
GISAKIEAARQAGAKKVIIPAENWQELFANYTDIAVVPVKTLDEVLDEALVLQGRARPELPLAALLPAR